MCKGVQGGSRGFENWRRGPHEGKMVRGSSWGIEHKETVVARKVVMRSLVAARGKSRSRLSYAMKDWRFRERREVVLLVEK